MFGPPTVVVNGLSKCDAIKYTYIPKMYVIYVHIVLILIGTYYVLDSSYCFPGLVVLVLV